MPNPENTPFCSIACWPRGLRKQRLEGVIWEKDATPSNELRSWFHEDPQERFDSFGTRFTQEVADSDAAQEALKRIRALHRKFGSLTLLTAARIGSQPPQRGWPRC